MPSCLLRALPSSSRSQQSGNGADMPMTKMNVRPFVVVVHARLPEALRAKSRSVIYLSHSA